MRRVRHERVFYFDIEKIKQFNKLRYFLKLSIGLLRVSFFQFINRRKRKSKKISRYNFIQQFK